MTLSTFDTLKFVRRLEAAGVPAQQAEVQAEVLTEAFNVNLDALVTKDFLAARFAEQSSSIDTRFAEQNSSIDTRFAEQNASIDTRFAEHNASIATRFAEQNASIDTRFAELRTDFDAKFRVHTVMHGIVMAAVVLPLVERLAAL